MINIDQHRSECVSQKNQFLLPTQILVIVLLNLNYYLIIKIYWSHLKLIPFPLRVGEISYAKGLTFRTFSSSTLGAIISCIMYTIIVYLWFNIDHWWKTGVDYLFIILFSHLYYLSINHLGCDSEINHWSIKSTQFKLINHTKFNQISVRQLRRQTSPVCLPSVQISITEINK